VVLTIAGFDPSSGAGITADLKVFAAHHLYGIAAVTALTVQSTAGVRRSEVVATGLLEETLACLAEDLPIAGVKLGMLGTAAHVAVVAEFLGELRGSAGRRVAVVLDPVVRSSSGHALLDAEGVELLRTRLLPLVDCVTPNSGELLLLAGLAETGRSSGKNVSEQEVVEAAVRLRALMPDLAVVATGGHLAEAHDLVVGPGMDPVWLRGEWVKTRATHGTGCAHSSALLCGLVAGLRVDQAARAAKEYVTAALRAARPMGAGGGCMDHLYVFSQVAGGEAAFGGAGPSSKERVKGESGEP
jgi:hydroxymethylpyrimidine/phosphomethylpyrimidine kinase